MAGRRDLFQTFDSDVAANLPEIRKLLDEIEMRDTSLFEFTNKHHRLSSHLPSCAPFEIIGRI
jgi:hypothetical protein